MAVNRRILALGSVILLLVLKTPCVASPNILFIMSDDHATHELNNVYTDPGYEDIVTRLKQDLLQLKTDLGDNDEAYPELMAVRREHG